MSQFFSLLPAIIGGLIPPLILIAAGQTAGSTGAIVIGIGFLFYFIPTIVAYAVQSEHDGIVTAVNLFLGWTGVGWVVALCWALASPRRVEVGRGAV